MTDYSQMTSLLLNTFDMDLLPPGLYYPLSLGRYLTVNKDFIVYMSYIANINIYIVGVGLLH